jgi:hypothetical protein
MESATSISIAEFLEWEERARREINRAIVAFEAAGDIKQADRARVTLAFIDRAVVVAHDGRRDNDAFDSYRDAACRLGADYFFDKAKQIPGALTVLESLPKHGQFR